jgi:hypothetical protein
MPSIAALPSGTLGHAAPDAVRENGWVRFVSFHLGVCPFVAPEMNEMHEMK